MSFFNKVSKIKYSLSLFFTFKFMTLSKIFNI